MLCLENPQIHSEDEAKALWIGHLEEFRASFIPVPADIIKTLEKISPDLPVRHEIRDPAVLGMFEDAVVIPEEAVLLKGDCEVAFQIDGRVGLRLVVLAEEPAGWRILGPGPRHTGRIENRPERVPNVAPMTIRFKAPYGTLPVRLYRASLQPFAATAACRQYCCPGAGRSGAVRSPVGIEGVGGPLAMVPGRLQYFALAIRQSVLLRDDVVR